MRGAGAMRHRATFEQRVSTRDADGAAVESWGVFAAGVPCALIPLSGREFIAANETQREVTARVELRYLPGVTSAMRIVIDGAVYAIKGVFPDATGRRSLNIMVAAGVGSE